MKSLVTGATGFVGSHLVEALAGRGGDVTALVRSPGKADLLNQLGVRQVRGDLHDKAALAEAVLGQDVIYHVAGITAARDEAGFLRANRDGTKNLIAAAEQARHGVAEPPSRRAAERPRFVLVSSMAAGGPSGRGRPLQGDEPARPVTAYGRSKLEGEEAVRASCLRWTIVRPPLVYGPRDTEVLKVFKLVRTGMVPVFGDGTQELSAVTGPDLAQALIAAGASDQAVGRTYYACHPEVFTSEQFALAVGAALNRRVRVVHLPQWLATTMLGVTGGFARIAGKATILTPDKANEFFQPAWTGDPSPLMRDTGWVAAQDLATGLERAAAWYRGAGWM
jgi:nucleoside-diphosphate-sugar epimerase